MANINCRVLNLKLKIDFVHINELRNVSKIGREEIRVYFIYMRQMIKKNFLKSKKCICSSSVMNRKQLKSS